MASKSRTVTVTVTVYAKSSDLDVIMVAAFEAPHQKAVVSKLPVILFIPLYLYGLGGIYCIGFIHGHKLLTLFIGWVVYVRDFSFLGGYYAS